jgi:WD40 repeat protein
MCGSCAGDHVAGQIPLSHVESDMHDSDTDWAVGEVSVSNDQGPRLDLAAMDCDIPMDGDALNVSVMSLGGEVLATVKVSCRSTVWELKGMVEKGVPGRHMKAVDGAMVGIIYAAIYKLFVCTAAGEWELWNEEGKCEGTFLDPWESVVYGAEFTPDSTFVLTRHAFTARLWRVDTRQRCPFSFGHGCNLVSAAFSPTGTTVLSACRGNDVKLWSVSSGQCVNRLELGDFGDLITAFTAGGGVALHTPDGRIALWNVETGHRVWEYQVDCIPGCRIRIFFMR